MFMKVLWKFDYKNIILNSKAKPSDKLEWKFCHVWWL
jgi:hypothetical protein